MGELRVRKRGKKWEYSFEGARINGQRNPISKSGFRTKAEAVTAGTAAKAEYDNCGRSFSPKEISVADYLDYWLLEHVKKNLRHNTYLDYESKVRIHLKPALGRYKLQSIEPDIIQKWVDDLALAGYSKSMVHNTLSCLSGALNYAVVPLKYIKSNPCLYAKPPRIRENPLSKEHREYVCIGEEFDQIISRFPEGSNFYIPIMLGYTLGTRLGESYGFDLLEDVDFKSHVIHIRQQAQKEGGTWFYRAPKYDSYRTLKMGATIENILRKEITNRKKNMMKYGQYFTKTYLLPDNSIMQARADITLPYREIMPTSTQENGNILTPDSFKYCARVVHKELGNPLFHSHCLRHTHGTILAEAGVNPKAVMERMGHKNLKETLETYTFCTDKMQDAAVDAFESAIS